MSISMSVGKVILDTEFIFVEVKKNLFLISLMGTTMQNGGTRERKRIFFEFLDNLKFIVIF